MKKLLALMILASLTASAQLTKALKVDTVDTYKNATVYFKKAIESPTITAILDSIAARPWWILGTASAMDSARVVTLDKAQTITGEKTFDTTRVKNIIYQLYNSIYGTNVETGKILSYQSNESTIDAPLTFYNRVGNVFSEKMRLSDRGNLLIGAVGDTYYKKLYINGASRTTGRAYVDRGLVVKNDTTTHKVFAFGNSLTYSEGNGYYESALNDLLGARWTVENLGISGQNTTQMLERFYNQVVEAGDCEYIIVWGGINDIIQGYPNSTIQYNLQTIYSAAQAFGLKVVALTISPFKGSAWWTAARQDSLETVNTWISSTATGIDYVVDINSVLNDGSDSLQSAYRSSDYLHLSKAGYDTVGANVYRGVVWTPGGNPTNALFVLGSIDASQDITVDRYLFAPYRVGIGTTSPDRQLVISDSGRGGIEFRGTSSWGSPDIISYNRLTSAYAPLRFDASAYTFGTGVVTFDSTPLVSTTDTLATQAYARSFGGGTSADSSIYVTITREGDSLQAMREWVEAQGYGTGTASADSDYIRVRLDSLRALNVSRIQVVSPMNLLDSLFVNGTLLFDKSGVPYFTVDSAIIASNVWPKMLALGGQDSLNARARSSHTHTVANITGLADSLTALWNAIGTYGGTGTGSNFNGAITQWSDTLINASGQWDGAPIDTSRAVMEEFRANIFGKVVAGTGITKTTAGDSMTISASLPDTNRIAFKDKATAFALNVTAPNLNDTLGYGGIYIEDADPDTMTIAAINVFKTVKGFSSGGVLSGVTAQDSSITLTNAGTYQLSWSATCNGLNFGDDSKINGYLYINDVKQSKTGSIMSLHNALDWKATSGFGLVQVAAGAIVKLKVCSVDDASATLYIRYANINAVRIN